MTHADPYARLGDAFLAHRHLPRPSTPHRTLGAITLLPHQQAAIAPLVSRLRRHHGALLADAPGLGKTYVALAVADALHVPRPLVLAPATLRTRWLDAARETGARIRFVSLESLGRTSPDDVRRAHERTPLVIVDEAHHLRTIATRRWHATAALCDGARVLLLSATPVHNRGRDATTLAALFHVAPGSRQLARLLRRITVHRPLEAIRAAAPDALAMLDPPAIRATRTITLDTHDAALPRRIERLPPLPLDGDAAGHARSRLALLHAWASSTAALAAMLRRRIARCVAIEAALDAGLAPDAPLLRAWHTDAEGTAVQLALAPLLASSHDRTTTTAERTAVVDAYAPDDATRRDTATHRRALEQLLRALGTHDDDARARTLRRIARWSAAPVVAFTRSRITARALWRRLRHLPGTALLTGDDAAIASGTVHRDELLAMLRDGAARAAATIGTPPAHRAHDMHDEYAKHGHQPHTRAGRFATGDTTVIRLLVTTDVAAEGLSLAGTRTVVHLDDPWTPARLAQRAGRAARLGAPVSAVTVLRLTLPAALPCIARVRRILERKRSLVAHAAGAVARGLDPRAEADIARIARRWCDGTQERSPTRTVHDHPDRSRDARDAPDARETTDVAWLVAFRARHALHLRVVQGDGTMRRASIGDWHAADRARTSAASLPDVPAHVPAAIARWWRVRADPLDRVLRNADDEHTADAPALARLRRLVDVALAGASPVERVACVRGAERARRTLRTGTGARTLDALARRAVDPVAARRWLASLGDVDSSDTSGRRGVHRDPNTRARSRGGAVVTRVSAEPRVIAAVPFESTRTDDATARASRSAPAIGE